MSDKSFGVKKINLIGASGTPTIESPNNLNINAINVAISTDVTIGGQLGAKQINLIGAPGTPTIESPSNLILNAINVGIGTTNPQYKLDVGGDINFTGTLYQNGTPLSRNTASATTGSIGVGNTDNISIAAAKTYVLYSIETDYPAWVTLYTDSASRTADASRLETTDPLPGSGVVAEVITTSGNLTQLITPGTIGFNNDGTPSSTVYAKVVNKHTSTVGIAVTIKYLKLED